MGETAIRDVNVGDARKLLEIYAYYVKNTAITFEYEVPSLSEFENRIASTIEKYPYLCIVSGGEIAGYAYAGAFRTRTAYQWSAEVTIYLDRNARGAGLGRRLYEELETRLKAAGIENLYACVTSPSVSDDPYVTTASEVFHERMGFTKAGTFHRCGYKFDRWYNMIWMEKLIGERENGRRRRTEFGK
ncbi:MAG: N-acetyltransferase family protein [Treponema sp.]